VRLTIHTQSAFVRMPVVIWIFGSRDHAERTCGDTVAATIADVILNVNISKFVVDDRTRRARLFAWRLFAMLANVTHHQPAVLQRAGAVGSRLFLERDMTPGSCTDMNGVVVAVAGEGQAVGWELVPLFARDLARLAANAESRIREKTHHVFAI